MATVSMCFLFNAAPAASQDNICRLVKTILAENEDYSKFEGKLVEKDEDSSEHVANVTMPGFSSCKVKSGPWGLFVCDRYFSNAAESAKFAKSLTEEIERCIGASAAEVRRKSKHTGFFIGKKNPKTVGINQLFDRKKKQHYVEFGMTVPY